ncbi:MAG: response regulator [Deltaproteobacteria bacterium]|nr:response regulator [Deltaproteobacteria bacterium]
MVAPDILDGKRILVVDDEPDILDVLEELLSMCRLDRASSFEEAKVLLDSSAYDLAILDIMGVDGYKLLEMARNKGIVTVMLTAHAFTPEDLVKSIKKGADCYLPKEEMGNIKSFLIDVIKAKKGKRSPWSSWEERLPSSYFEKRWGAAWEDKDKEFWERFRASIKARRS